MNVLLVDDELIELEQLEFMIQPLFPLWKFFKATDASKAKTICNDIKINLAFLDINLPGKSGLELGEQIKKMNSGIDIIIVTAYQEFQFAKQSIRLGVIDYLTKPIIQNELEDVLKKYKTNNMPKYTKTIQDVLTIIHERYDEKLNLNTLAAEVFMNPAYLSRRFHEEVNKPLFEYLIQFRIKMAKKLLVENTNWSISIIADKVGFNSQHYFSTTFRKVEGISPKDYRERKR
ncbi:response regulator transcription factor [Aquibacillus albus]|uniref:YesN/AraC family two-component response regulator n=1 Tax=Aquibacillus albus TaxID=1168171 RepID=A0ABS2MVX3_9BACI|nr:helix-turn-helix domain-containing protein [Aquibacillus albus]MBM7570051.1 YesN/AraC family two-component response regulator [Aquibacillus albus]